MAFLFFGCSCRVDPPAYEHLTFSADGKDLLAVYSRSGSAFIYRIPLDTGRAVRFTTAKRVFEEVPACSTDGRRVVFTESERESRDDSTVIIANADGSDYRRLAIRDAAWPLLLHDDSTLLFARYGYFGNYDGSAQMHAHEWDFYTADLTGMNVRQLTNENLYSLSRPSLSPDGKSIVFIGPEFDSQQRHQLSARYKNDPAVLADHLREIDAEAITIYSLEQPPKARRVYKPHVVGEPRSGPIYGDPVFLPDGANILFRAASGNPYDYDVYALNLQSENAVKVTNGNGYAYSLTVAPNGKVAAFIRKEWHDGEPGRSAIFLLDLASGRVTPFAVSGIE